MNRLLWLLALIVLNFSAISAQTEEEEEMLTESSELDTSMFYDDLFMTRMISENRVVSYEPIREADIVWEKRIWRVIDVREKMNQKFIYPQRYFFTILLDAVKNGEMHAFRGENFGTPMDAADIDKDLNKIDTTTVYNPDTYEEEIKIVKNDFNPEDVKRYRVKEIWYFDKEASLMKVRILGIAPMRDEKGADGSFKYEVPVFWAYFPEARTLLSRERAFNEINDMAPMTWADVFDSRFFSSYIYKETNASDSRLQDIYKEDGVDLLLESEKIKNKLFNYEHDLWTY